MKNVVTALVSLVIGAVLFLSGCSLSGGRGGEKKVIVVKESDIVRKDIGVRGMTCVGCEVTLEDNISRIEGVVHVRASHADKKVTVEFDSTKTDIQSITRVISKSGYNLLSN